MWGLIHSLRYQGSPRRPSSPPAPRGPPATAWPAGSRWWPEGGVQHHSRDARPGLSHTSKCMYKYIHMCIHIYIYVWRESVCVDLFTNIYLYIYILYIYIYLTKYLCFVCVYRYTYTYTYIYVYVCIHSWDKSFVSAEPFRARLMASALLILCSGQMFAVFRTLFCWNVQSSECRKWARGSMPAARSKLQTKHKLHQIGTTRF